MPRPIPDILKRLKEQGYYPFVAIFSWEFSQDGEAIQKMLSLFKNLPEGIPRDAVQGYYLTGERTLIFIGYTNSPVHLQRLCASVTFESAIEVKTFHAVEVHDVTELMEKWPTQ